MILRVPVFIKKILCAVLAIYVLATLAAIAGAIAIAGTPLGRWLEDAQRNCCTPFENLQSADAIVILGGDEGSRTIAAEKAFRAGKAPAIIISADEDRILDALLAGGIPRERIFIDPNPQRTIDHPRTIQGICGITPQSRIIVTSSRLQEARAKHLFEKAGYDAVQIYSFERDYQQFKDEHPEKFPPDSWDYQRVLNVSYSYLAWLKYFIVD